MKIFRWIGVVLGFALVGYLIHEVGPGEVLRSLGLLRWGYLLVILYPLTWIVLNTAGWRSALHLQYSSLSLKTLALIRVVGETFNSLLPSGYVGGEPLKVKLLANHIPASEAASSVLIAKSAQSVGMVVFVGLGLSFGRVGGHSPLQDPRTWWALGFLTAGISMFTWLLASRSFSRAGRWLHSVTRIHWLRQQESWLIALDESLGRFYREGRSRFLQSTLWHLVGWLAGALEVAIIFGLLGHPVSWTQAWFIGAMAQLAAVIGLVVPAGVGLYEGGHYMAATLLGLDPALGLTVSLIRRVREVFWDGVGVVALWQLGRQKRV